jgi:mannose-6-phosphate isomerase-like protein (cupin superfamily)
MKLERADLHKDKGWYVGPWDGSPPLPVGYANVGVDDPHLHMRVTEIYLIARGTADVRVERETIPVTAGDVLIVEPGEAHTFLSNSPEYFHFVLQVPGLSPDEVQAERISVSRGRLGL